MPALWLGEILPERQCLNSALWVEASYLASSCSAMSWLRNRSSVYFAPQRRVSLASTPPAIILWARNSTAPVPNNGCMRLPAGTVPSLSSSGSGNKAFPPSTLTCRWAFPQNSWKPSYKVRIQMPSEPYCYLFSYYHPNPFLGNGRNKCLWHTKNARHKIYEWADS